MARSKKNTYDDSSGYKRYKDSGKSVHRQAAKKKLGRDLKRSEVVHHRDGNKRNNSPDNLEVMNRSKHSRLHASQRSVSCLVSILSLLGSCFMIAYAAFLLIRYCTTIL